MKMIYAIVHADDAGYLTKELNKQKFSVTTLNTTGGFLRKGNATLFIGTEDERVEEAIQIISKNCGKRKQVIYNMPCAAGSLPMTNCAPIPVTVDVGGATVFVMDVERFEKI